MQSKQRARADAERSCRMQAFGSRLHASQSSTGRKPEACEWLFYSAFGKMTEKSEVEVDIPLEKRILEARRRNRMIGLQ